MYATSSALASIAAFGTDTGALVTSGIALALAGGVALLGLGFAWRHIKKYVTGRKF